MQELIRMVIQRKVQYEASGEDAMMTRELDDDRASSSGSSSPVTEAGTTKRPSRTRYWCVFQMCKVGVETVRK